MMLPFQWRPAGHFETKVQRLVERRPESPAFHKRHPIFPHCTSDGCARRHTSRLVRPEARGVWGHHARYSLAALHSVSVSRGSGTYVKQTALLQIFDALDILFFTPPGKFLMSDCTF